MPKGEFEMADDSIEELELAKKGEAPSPFGKADGILSISVRYHLEDESSFQVPIEFSN